MIAHTYQHTYTPTHPMKPGYLRNAIDWCERAYARHRALPEGENLDTIACVVGALDLLEAHKQACYDRWQYEQVIVTDPAEQAQREQIMRDFQAGRISLKNGEPVPAPKPIKWQPYQKG